MKRFISIIITMVIALLSAAPFAYADNERFTASAGELFETADYATREQAVACFIRAVGINRFRTDPAILDGFSDKTRVSFAYRDAMSAAVFSGLISGYDDKTLRPQSPITRIEALVILNRALSRDELRNDVEIKFTDTPAWAEKQVSRLAAAGIVKGYGNGTLGARDLMTLEQVNTLCERITRLTGPMNDFYEYINSNWLSKASKSENVLLSDMNTLERSINSQLSDIIFSLYRRHYHNGEEFADDSAEMRVITVYSAAANQSHRDKIGLSPITGLLNKIDSANTSGELIAAAAELEKSGFTTLIPIGVSVNPYDSSEYLPSFSEPYFGMDSIFLTNDDAEKYLALYRKYAERLFMISGENEENSKRSANAAAEICKTLAQAKSKPETSEEMLSMPVMYTADELSLALTNTDIKKYAALFGLDSADKFIVTDLGFLRAADKLLTNQDIFPLKAYLKASVLCNSAMYLTTDTFTAYRDFISALYEKPSDAIPSDYAVSITEELLGRELGMLYVDLYFPETAKAAADKLAKRIIDEYKSLISSCTRMSPKSRAAAIRKLNKMTVCSAHPDNMRDYCRTDIPLRSVENGGNLMEYKIQYARAYSESCSEIIRTKAKADKRLWYITPQTVNAMYDPQSNSITIPAGMLQPPFYDYTAEFEDNLGALGTVIAHEISHAFDLTGAKFDENGNLSEQWEPSDYSAFKAVCADVARSYDGIKTDAGAVDGNLTLNENVADIAGMSCIASLAKTDGLDLDKVFRAYAKLWRTKTTSEYAGLMLLSDVHSPAKVRVNHVLSNLDAFIDLYGVIEGDGMYIPPEQRINIWK